MRCSRQKCKAPWTNRWPARIAGLLAVLTLFVTVTVVPEKVAAQTATAQTATAQTATTQTATTQTATTQTVATQETYGSPPPAHAYWPTAQQIAHVITLRDYNTRIVLFGTTLLGVSGGLVGVFMLLRRRSLTADVVSHATFPGITIAFLTMEVISPGSGKYTPLLLLGAFLSGMFGMACVTLILKYTRIKEDAALAVVLSVFFGLGIALFTVIQNLPTGNAGGLGHFIYGKTASMVANDVWFIGGASLIVVLVFALLFKEWTLVSFDDQFAASQGWPVVRLDLLLLTLVTSVTVIGLQSVGMLLVVALMITPAAAARFWTYHLKYMALISAAIGGLSAVLGVIVSALFPRLAAGAVIVLAGSTLFLFSMLFGTRNGIILRGVMRYVRDRTIARDHLLRALFEIIETRSAPRKDWTSQLTHVSVTIAELLSERSWSLPRLRRIIQASERAGFVVDLGDAGVNLTDRGAALACRVVRSHRLWEIYLIDFADRSPQRVDRDADDIEHVLGPDTVADLERLLTERYPQWEIPPSPHTIERSQLVESNR